MAIYLFPRHDMDVIQYPSFHSRSTKKRSVSLHSQKSFVFTCEVTKNFLAFFVAKHFLEGIYQ